MDRDLIEAAQSGDRAAYVDLIIARQDRLFATAQRILRDIDRAEDALQDALVIAWRDLRGLRDPDRFDAWLQRLLINVCIAQATRERRRTTNLRVLPVDGPAGPDELLVSRRSGPARTRVPPAAARPAGDPRAPPLPRLRAVGDRRDTRHPCRHGPLEAPPRTSRHAGRPRGGRSDHGQGRSIGMTQHSDIERLLDHWFSDGPDQAPDRVIDIVTDRIERQSQRPAWRLQWRPIPMNAYAKLAVAAAAVLIVAVVGYNLLPGRSTGVGAPAPTRECDGYPRIGDAVRRAIRRCSRRFQRGSRETTSGEHGDGILAAGSHTSRIVPVSPSSFTSPAGWVNSADRVRLLRPLPGHARQSKQEYAALARHWPRPSYVTPSPICRLRRRRCASLMGNSRDYGRRRWSTTAVPTRRLRSPARNAVTIGGLSGQQIRRPSSIRTGRAPARLDPRRILPTRDFKRRSGSRHPARRHPAARVDRDRLVLRGRSSTSSSREAMPIVESFEFDVTP